jgi:hypothetical protein
MFPSFRYHPTEPARIVADPSEVEALGEDWRDTPYHLESPHVYAPGDEPEEDEAAGEDEAGEPTAKKKTRKPRS